MGQGMKKIIKAALITLPFVFIGSFCFLLTQADMVQLIHCSQDCYSPFRQVTEWYTFNLRGTPDDIRYNEQKVGLANVIDDEKYLRFMLSKGANVNSKDAAGFTALHSAVVSRRSDIVKVLLAYHADKTINDAHGHTPIDYATTEDLKKLLQ